MSYRIIEGTLQQQSVKGGRWEPVSREETQRLLDQLSSLSTPPATSN